MNQFNLNHKPEESDLARSNEVVDKLSGDLESLILEKTVVDRDLSSPTSVVNSNYVPQKALYIAEIGDRFYFLDYAVAELDPKPLPIEAGSLAKLPQPDKVVKKSSTPTPDEKTNWFSSKQGLLLGLGLGILLTFGATKIFSASSSDSNNTPQTIEAATVPSQTVTAIEVTTTDIDSNLNASGTVTAYETTPVMSQASGLKIIDVLAERGDYVERGQILAKLDDKVLNAEKTEAQGAVTQARSQLEELRAGTRVEEIAQAESRVANARSAVVRAESDLELVQKRVERNTSLQAEGAISRDRLDEILNQERVAQSNLAGAEADLNEAQQELVQLKAGSRPQTIAKAEAELTQASGRLQAIEARLTDTIITAPRAGIIASREATVGQITSNSEMLFTIIQNGRLELRLQIPETLIGQIRAGQKVQITAENRNLKLTGRVRAVDPAIDDSSRQATVRVDLPGGNNLKPGMFLQAAINTDTNPGLAVPTEALLPQSGDRAIAFIVRGDNTVQAQTVVLGEMLSEQRVEIVEGLQSGDRIVVKGAAYLKDGDTVEIAE